MKMLREMDTVYLPDDIFYYLMNYLDRVDCVSLSVSGVWPRFTYLYQQNRSVYFYIFIDLGMDFFEKNYYFYLSQGDRFKGMLSSGAINFPVIFCPIPFPRKSNSL